VSDDLDLLRGLAAVAVLIYHVRYRFFYDYANLSQPDWAAKGFYALTSFGHDAVIIFFVLSGYFISSSVLRDAALGRWSWTIYTINRLARLYVVLLPGLLLTLCWDRLGLWLFPNAPVYTGAPQSWIHDFFPVQPRLQPDVVFGNASFLQTILVPPLGSNEALWSLSYEFWYYVLFPLAYFAWRAKSEKTIAGAALVAGLLWFVGVPIAIYFPIWLMGAAVCVAPMVPKWMRTHPRAVALAAMLLFVLVVAITHTRTFGSWAGGSQIARDYVTAVVFTVVLYVLLHNRAPSRVDLYQAIARTLSGFSYTLYISHLPILVFIRAAWSRSPLDATWQNMGLALVLALICLGYAYAIARLTEARTDRARKALTRVISSISPVSKLTLPTARL
jgi:peptidoglycan/LPS O-acetylase OafA/YrhL